MVIFEQHTCFKRDFLFIIGVDLTGCKSTKSELLSPLSRRPDSKHYLDNLLSLLIVSVMNLFMSPAESKCFAESRPTPKPFKVGWLSV